MSCGWNGNSEVPVQNSEYHYCIANALHGKFWYICLKCYYGIPAHFIHSGLFLFPMYEKGIEKHFIKPEYNSKTLVGLSRGRYGFAFILCKQNTFQLVKLFPYLHLLMFYRFCFNIVSLFFFFSLTVMETRIRVSWVLKPTMVNAFPKNNTEETPWLAIFRSFSVMNKGHCGTSQVSCKF